MALTRYSTGTMVANDTAGNITRPPSLSVRAPTGMRPKAPTITGTATISACWNEVRCSESFSFGASGLSRSPEVQGEADRRQGEHQAR